MAGGGGARERGGIAGEFAKILRLASVFGTAAPRVRGVTLGIGDDAAILRPRAGRELVWTIDAQVEGQHFRREWMTLEDIGWRSFVAAASDLAAMGAEPWCALSALALPDDVEDGGLGELSQGQADAARAVGCPIVGGNLSRGGELSVTTTLLGTAMRAVRRSGARQGDGVWLAGQVGLAAVGLRALMLGYAGGELDAAIAAFRRPRVRIDSGRILWRHARAAIDVSDGLAADAGHIASASGVAIVLDEASLAAHAGPAVQRASLVGASWLDLVLHGGEDYAILATSLKPLEGFSRIGVVESGVGVWLRAPNGEQHAIEPRGFDHFEPLHP